MSNHTKLPRVVLDTDTYNEVDDQFALAHLMLAPEKVNVEAVYAAPFHNERSNGPEDGMERSYEEIQRVLELLSRRPSAGVFKGSRSYMSAADVPVESPAAADLIDRAMEGDGPLIVCAIGAITNVASALVMEPRIAERIQIVWLGGHAHHWSDTREFNLRQDPHASRIVLSGKVPMVQIPCMGVASHMQTTVYELDALLAPFSRLGEYLASIVRSYTKNVEGWSKRLWDLSASAYVLDQRPFKVVRTSAPLITDDLCYRQTSGGPCIDVVSELDRDAIFRDFFARARNSDPA